MLISDLDNLRENLIHFGWEGRIRGVWTITRLGNIKHHHLHLFEAASLRGFGMPYFFGSIISQS